MKIEITNTSLSIVRIEHGFKPAVTLAPDQLLALEIEHVMPVVVRSYTQDSNVIVISNKSKLSAEIEAGVNPVATLKAGKSIDVAVGLMSPVFVRELVEA
jgi:hypothetical protein